jgi:hypothetical protein
MLIYSCRCLDPCVVSESNGACAQGVFIRDRSANLLCCVVLCRLCCALLCCRYDSHPQHTTAGPTGALLLVTTYAPPSSTFGDSTAAVGDLQGKDGTGQQQQQQLGATWMCSRQLLEHTIAPAVELDGADA